MNIRFIFTIWFHGVLVGFMIGTILHKIVMDNFKQEAVDHYYAVYDNDTGNWRWIHD